MQWIPEDKKEQSDALFDGQVTEVYLIDGHALPPSAIRKALAQPEQEPVAWRNAAIRVGEDLCSVGPFGYYDMTAKQWLDWALSVVTVHAPPPQRQWVGLTDEERDHLEGLHLYAARNQVEAWIEGVPAFIDAIEAKLREKNGC